jgi:hypothetical protein
MLTFDQIKSALLDNSSGKVLINNGDGFNPVIGIILLQSTNEIWIIPQSGSNYKLIPTAELQIIPV